MPVKYPSSAASASAVAAAAVATKRSLWYPNGLGSTGGGDSIDQTKVIDESGPRFVFTTSQTIATGTLRCVGNLFVPQGVTVAGLFVYFATSASGPTHSWMVLIDQALNVLGKSADATTDALTAGNWKKYALTTPWVAPVDTAVYAGFCQVSTVTQVGLTVGPGTINAIPSQQPRLGFQPVGGLSVPGDVGSTVTFSSASNAFYAALYTT